MAAFDGDLYVVGNFTAVGESFGIPSSHIARWTDPAPTSVALPGLVDGTPRLAVRPNPTPSGVAITFSVPAGREYDVRIHDVAGRVVRRLPSGVGDGTAQWAAWDTRNAAGHPVAPGVYFVRVAVRNGLAETRKIAVVR